MRGLTISAHGGLDRVELRDDLPLPTLANDSQVRVRVRAAALNHLDLFVVGGLPNVKIVAPWIIGADALGTIEAIGDAVQGLTIGETVVINPGISDRSCEYCLAGEQPLCPRFGVLGEHYPGTLADYVVVPATNVRVVPPDADPTEGAALILSTLTAWRMLVSRARLMAGEHVLIWGIGGGVALACLQIAKQLGARVTVTSRSDDKLARARRLGADDVIHHGEVDVGREVRARTAKRGVDVVVDSVGEATWTQSLGALGRRGRLVTCGGTSGPMVTTDVRRLFWNQWSILGSTMGNDAELDAVVSEFRQGRLRPIVDSVYPLDAWRSAFERMRGGEQFGKLVVRFAPRPKSTRSSSQPSRRRSAMPWRQVTSRCVRATAPP